MLMNQKGIMTIVQLNPANQEPRLANSVFPCKELYLILHWGINKNSYAKQKIVLKSQLQSGFAKFEPAQYELPYISTVY